MHAEGMVGMRARRRGRKDAQERAIGAGCNFLTNWENESNAEAANNQNQKQWLREPEAT
jgi:hypothetical protein